MADLIDEQDDINEMDAGDRSLAFPVGTVPDRDGPNTHRYHDAPFVTEWSVYPLHEPTNGDPVTHYFHVPQVMDDQWRDKYLGLVEQWAFLCDLAGAEGDDAPHEVINAILADPDGVRRRWDLAKAQALIDADPRLEGMDAERLRVVRALVSHQSCLGCGAAGEEGDIYCATHGDWLCDRCVSAIRGLAAIPIPSERPHE